MAYGLPTSRTAEMDFEYPVTSPENAENVSSRQTWMGSHVTWRQSQQLRYSEQQHHTEPP